MYFDFDDRYRDIEPVGSAINRRDGVAVSILVHAAIVAVCCLRRHISSSTCPSAWFPRRRKSLRVPKMHPALCSSSRSVDLPPLAPAGPRRDV